MAAELFVDEEDDAQFDDIVENKLPNKEDYEDTSHASPAACLDATRAVVCAENFLTGICFE